MIPKIIHYCWFGGNEMPTEYKSYIDDWRALHPDWEIKLWDESNAPEDSNYLLNSLKEKKWSNCSNFIRLYALKEYGGIYFDTDIKVIRAFDELINLKCFLGFESSDADSFVVNNAVMGAEPRHPFVARCLEILESQFDGVEESDLSGPGLTTSVLKKEWGLKTYGNQLLNNEAMVFETEYFYPIHIHLAHNLQQFEQYITANTFAVHMWGRSWVSKEKLISIVDYLNFKTAEQDKYIAQLQHINKESDAKANEIYFWKVHFEKEYNRIQEIYHQLLNERTEENDLLRTDPFNSSITKLFQLIENTNKEITERIRVVENSIQSITSAMSSNQAAFAMKNEGSLGKINEQLNELRKSKDKLEKLEAWSVEFGKNNSAKENMLNQILRDLPDETAQNVTELLNKKIQEEYLPIKEGNSKMQEKMESVFNLISSWQANFTAFISQANHYVDTIRHLENQIDTINGEKQRIQDCLKKTKDSNDELSAQILSDRMNYNTIIDKLKNELIEKEQLLTKAKAEASTNLNKLKHDSILKILRERRKSKFA